METTIKEELKVWQNWVFNNLPIADLETRVLCTYVEAFAVPFKLKAQMLVSYNKPFKNLFIRNKYWNEAEKLVSEGIVDSYVTALGNYPEKFVLSTAYQFQFIATKYRCPYVDVSIGKLTGRYYIDVYGYCWLEMKNNFLAFEDVKNSWVRETAIKYEGKENLQIQIDEVRKVIMEMRAGKQEPGPAKKTTGLTLLTSAVLFLLNRQ